MRAFSPTKGTQSSDPHSPVVPSREPSTRRGTAMRCGFHQVKAHWVLANEFADEQSGCHAFFTLEIEEEATGTQCPDVAGKEIRV